MTEKRPATILVIDDDESVRLSIAAYLEDSGYLVFEAENGRVGVDIFLHQHIDLILVDLRMPVMNGLEVLAHITKISPDTPMIVVSGIGVIKDAVEALHQGAWDYILKPIEEESILDHAIENALEKARLKQENLEYQQNLEQMVVKRTEELQQANEQLLENEKQLRQVQKMEALGTLAGGIAHDFNNILGIIVGCAELSLMQSPDNHPSTQHMHQVLNAGKRAADLVQQILTFSRKKELIRQPLQVSIVVKEVIKMLRATLPSTIEIVQNIAIESDMVMADPVQIHQIVMNLATNASHAMHKNGGVLKIELNDIEVDQKISGDHKNLSPGPYLKLTVSDTGHGISSDHLRRIFDPYFTTKTQEEGTGLGLAVVAGIIEKYQGCISVQSTIGQGTCFDVFLPRIPEEQKPNISQKNSLTLPKGTENILVVDDDVYLANITGKMLKNLGYQVEVETDSRQVLEAFEKDQYQFDLLLIDVTMPKMPGDELARKLFRLGADLPIILYTGYSDRIDWTEIKETGIADYIFKPVHVTELATKVRQALDQASPGATSH